jgi:hypothetical protein
MPTHAGDVVAEPTLVVARYYCCGAMSLLSHAVGPKSGSMIVSMMCDQSQDVPAL